MGVDMSQYLMYGSITYSNVANRNTALGNLQDVANQYSDVLTPADAGPYAVGGVSNPSGNIVEFAYLVDELNLEVVRDAFRTARLSGTKSGAVVSTVRIT